MMNPTLYIRQQFLAKSCTKLEKKHTLFVVFFCKAVQGTIHGYFRVEWVLRRPYLRKLPVFGLKHRGVHFVHYRAEPSSTRGPTAEVYRLYTDAGKELPSKAFFSRIPVRRWN